MPRVMVTSTRRRRAAGTNMTAAAISGNKQAPSQQPLNKELINKEPINKKNSATERRLQAGRISARTQALRNKKNIIVAAGDPTQAIQHSCNEMRTQGIMVTTSLTRDDLHTPLVAPGQRAGQGEGVKQFHLCSGNPGRIQQIDKVNFR